MLVILDLKDKFVLDHCLVFKAPFLTHFSLLIKECLSEAEEIFRKAATNRVRTVELLLLLFLLLLLSSEIHKPSSVLIFPIFLHFPSIFL